MIESDDGILESFFEQAGDLADEFIEHGLQIIDTRSPDENLQVIFRGVHSLKGTASFLGSSDARLALLTEYCHKFETFLDGVRKGTTQLTPQVRELIAEGLNTLHDDIQLLMLGNEIEQHKELYLRFEKSAKELVHMENSNGFLVIRPMKSLQLLDDIEHFTRLMWENAKKLGPEGKLILDLDNRVRLSSIAVGTIIGTASIVQKFYIVNAPPFMELVFRRFRLEEVGVIIKGNISECK